MSDRIDWKPRHDFLAQRRRDYIETVYAWRRAGSPPGVVIIEPDNDVICDLCNAEVMEDSIPLRVLESGSRAVLCVECVLAWDARRGRKTRKEGEAKHG